MIPVRDAAKGRWPNILPALGIDAAHLTGKPGPCPLCKAGTDRWRFDDKDGKGTWFCSFAHDGKRAGDGVALVMLANGWDFTKAAREIEKLVGVAPVSIPGKAVDPAKVRERMNALWRQAKPLTAIMAAREWWMARIGETPVCGDLRAVDALKYQDGLGGSASHHPAMLALVRGSDGKAVNVHRTYLAAGGRKAAVPKVRKLTGGLTLAPGSAVRLAPAQAVMGIAEGIETAVAASKLCGLPVWAALNASNLERWTPPPGVLDVVVFGDNDAAKEFTGQTAAYALARRLKSVGLAVNVMIPTEPGDWNDVWLARSAPDANDRTAA